MYVVGSVVVRSMLVWKPLCRVCGVCICAAACVSTFPAATAGAASASVDDELAAARDAAKAANASLAGQWGAWFDFNDSNVSPMGVTNLQKAFQGVAGSCLSPDVLLVLVVCSFV